MSSSRPSRWSSIDAGGERGTADLELVGNDEETEGLRIRLAILGGDHELEPAIGVAAECCCDIDAGTGRPRTWPMRIAVAGDGQLAAAACRLSLAADPACSTQPRSAPRE